MIAAMILAAGKSQRMGWVKPIHPLSGETPLARISKTFRSAGIMRMTGVVGHHHERIKPVMAENGISPVMNPDPEATMFDSIRAGIEALPEEVDAFFLMPADIPLVRPHTIRQLAAAFQEAMVSDAPPVPLVVHPTFTGRRGHPPLISMQLAPAIRSHDGRHGLAGLLAQYEDRSAEVAVADEAILLDMDTPADYKVLAARAARQAARGGGAIPTEAECMALLETVAQTPAPVIAHCRAVAAAARRLAEALVVAGERIDMDLIIAGALLHDMDRVQPRHAAAGAARLMEMDCSAVAGVVGCHMDLVDLVDAMDDVDPIVPVNHVDHVGSVGSVDSMDPVNPDSVQDILLDERAVVYLADKLIQGENPVDPDQREAAATVRFAHDPEALAAARRRLDVARQIMGRIRKRTGIDPMTIIATPGPSGPFGSSVSSVSSGSSASSGSSGSSASSASSASSGSSGSSRSCGPS